MKTEWILVLLPLMVVGAYSAIADSHGESGRAPAEPAERMALDTTGGTVAGRVTGSNDRMSLDLPMYLQLHGAWSQSLPAPTTARMSACPE